MYQNFINEIYSGYLGVTFDGITPYLSLIERVMAGEAVTDQKEPLKLGLFDESLNDISSLLDKDEEKPASIAVITISGLFTKFGSWWDYGTEEYAAMLQQAYDDPSIKAIILKIHSSGGTVHSIFPMEEAINARNKPVISVIYSIAKSAGYYIAALTDKIYAVNRMAETGSIGVMAQLTNDDKMAEKAGIKIVTVIPPESKWKNKAYLEAKKGKPQFLIKEELTPWAIHFQNIVKKNRPNLDMSVDGIIEGRGFYAYDAVANGLVDEIMPYNQILEKAFNYTEDELTRLINKNQK